MQQSQKELSCFPGAANIFLQIAIAQGWCQAVHLAVKFGASVVAQITIRDCEFLPALHLAVRGLADLGADPNATDDCGQTALRQSAEAGKLEVLRLLAELG
ncbi:unnamed protein product, partial [Polarella glacialis]